MTSSRIISKLTAAVAVVIFVAEELHVVDSQGCDVNCAAGCSSAGVNRCDGPCYGGFYLTQNLTCKSLANLALRKTAYQISTFDGNVASRAVDGNSSTDLNSGSCSLTLRLVSNPWWLVDLGKKYSVIGINVTSRGDYIDDTSINNFIVGLTNEPPQPGQPVALYNYTLCGQYPRAVSVGTTVYQPCSRDLSQYRYAIIQTNSSLTGAPYMNLCEVEVYGFECDVKCLVGCDRYGVSTCNSNCTIGFGPSAAYTCEECDANCATGCNTKGNGKCDGLCKFGYGLTATDTCGRCDVNCAIGCKVAGANLCDEPCYGGFYLMQNKTCVKLATTTATVDDVQNDSTLKTSGLLALLRHHRQTNKEKRNQKSQQDTHGQNHNENNKNGGELPYDVIIQHGLP